VEENIDNLKKKKKYHKLMSVIFTIDINSGMFEG